MTAPRESGPATEDTADAALAARARALLQQSAEDLDGRTRSRLTQARHAALAAAGSRGPLAVLAELLRGPGGRRWQRWAPAGALAASVLVVALLVVRVPGTPGTPGMVAHATGGDELELLTDTDALALAQEPEVDYDFYEWAVDADAQDTPTAAVGS
jgi:hypothetical protein